MDSDSRHPASHHGNGAQGAHSGHQDHAAMFRRRFWLSFAPHPPGGRLQPHADDADAVERSGLPGLALDPPDPGHRGVPLAWGAGYNLFAIPLAGRVLASAGVTLSPAVGAVLMSASTLVVAINAQLLRRVDLTTERL